MLIKHILVLCCLIKKKLQKKMILETTFELSIYFISLKISVYKNEAPRWPGNEAKRLRVQTLIK